MSMLPPTPSEPESPPPAVPTANAAMTQPEPSPEAASPAASGSRTPAWLAVIVILLLVALACLAMGLIGAVVIPRGSAAAAVTPSPTPPVVSVTSLKKIAELATVEQGLVTDVEVTNVPDDWRQRLGLHERIVIIAHGTAKAGFDLEKIKDGDVWTDGKRVQLYLPSPELLSFEMDYDKSHLVDYDRTLLMPQDPDIQAKAYALAQARLKQAAQESNLLQMAEEYGRVYFENHLRSLGFEEVRVEFR